MNQALANKMFRYDFMSGKLFWRIKPCKRIVVGREITCIDNTTGYIRVGYKGNLYFIHRLIWLMHYGIWPIQIDHINHIKTDNRLCNLRNVTSLENGRNHSRASNNTSGCTGVCWDKANHKWRAIIRVGDKSIHLGRWSRFDLAVKARKAAEIKYGFHVNHGATPLKSVRLTRRTL